jgi:sodium-dependent dicarboxylate transporter 2/3/5
MTMIIKHKGFQLSIAILLGAAILVLPRPDGTTFKIVGDT